METSCVFCRIVHGEIPAVKVYENDEVLAFLDINPVEKGHTLVIPKAHHPTLMTTPDTLLGETVLAVRRVAAALMAIGAEGVNVLQSNHACAGQEVPHLHFHIVPRQNNGRPRTWVSGDGKYASTDERDRYAARLREAAAHAGEIRLP